MPNKERKIIQRNSVHRSIWMYIVYLKFVLNQYIHWKVLIDWLYIFFFFFCLVFSRLGFFFFPLLVCFLVMSCLMFIYCMLPVLDTNQVKCEPFPGLWTVSTLSCAHNGGVWTGEPPIGWRLWTFLFWKSTEVELIHLQMVGVEF